MAKTKILTFGPSNAGRWAVLKQLPVGLVYSEFFLLEMAHDGTKISQILR
jgi:hypothetical protein